MRVLMIDDDHELCELLHDVFKRFGVELIFALDGELGLKLLQARRFDIVLLDVMLPDISGFDILQRIRLTSDIVVIMLTAKGDEKDKVLGLNLGADDYLPKPFSSDELLARMKAILRRTNKSHHNNAIDIGDMSFTPARNTAVISGKMVKLTGVESVILKLLVSRAGEPVSRDHLYRTVLNREPMPYDRSLDTHVSSLRKKLGPMDDGAHRILSVRGVGYQYIA
ncbi:Transcriptional regulatory protein CpxR [Thalassocella blandensis]|nr:Transcriptional regulatory protein CpxR [Thalassocella blandensis]